LAGRDLAGWTRDLAGWTRDLARWTRDLAGMDKGVGQNGHGLGRKGLGRMDEGLGQTDKGLGRIGLRARDGSEKKKRWNSRVSAKPATPPSLRTNPNPIEPTHHVFGERGCTEPLEQKAESQQIVTARPLYCLQHPVPCLSRLQRVRLRERQKLQ
jgi:hypothetical protein